jgi:hypothetical protein
MPLQLLHFYKSYALYAFSDRLSLRCEVLDKEKETCKSPDPRLFLSKQRQFVNSQKKSGI